MKPSIMVVEDSLTVRMDLADSLGAAGLDTKLCATLAEARAALTQRAPDALVLDIALPDGDGTELLAEIRASEELADLPVLMLSEETAVADRIRGLAHGANEYVGKPYDAQFVVSRIRALLRERTPQVSSGPVVLVIDDSLTFREAMAELLNEAGFAAIVAVGGEDGLRQAATHRPDAIIVDGQMPDIAGTEVVRRVRLDPALQSIPCLLLTGTDQADSEIAALDIGADAFMRKEQSREAIIARLRAMMRATDTTSRDRPFTASALGALRILAVDDSRTYLEALTEQLQGEGYEVIRAISGQEALDLLRVERVDCILLDLVMPGISGIETCEQIKGDSQTRQVPLILLTSVEQSEAMVAGINAGADDFVSKSADIEVLKARLRAQMRRKQFEDENRRVREQLLARESESRAAIEIAEARRVLLEELAAKNSELAILNAELQTFAHTVSHDLRQPLRSLDGFCQVLQERYDAELDDKGRHYLERIRSGAQRMSELIDGLLVLSRASREEMSPRSLALDEIAMRILARLRDAEPDRMVDVHIEPDLVAHGDAKLIESVLENLLGNAWKFTARRDAATIAVGRTTTDDGAECFFVRDDGSGFDMDYADQLFAPFQRLHRREEFDGTGIGLATVQRIIRRHGGTIWARSVPGVGATFFFTIGTSHLGTES